MHVGQQQRCKNLRNYKTKHETAIYANLPIFIVLWAFLSTFRKSHFPFSYFHTKGLVKIQNGTWYIVTEFWALRGFRLPKAV